LIFIRLALLLIEFSKGKFGRPIDGHEEMELAAIVEREKRMLAESHRDGLVLNWRRSWD